MELKEYHELCDIPFQLDRERIKFKCAIKSGRACPIYQLRAVTKSGKIFRSAPVMPEKLPARKEMMNIFSETTGKVVAVPVLSALVPRLNWIFDPAAGDVLDENGFDPRFKCDLGGGYHYAGAYHGTPLPPGVHAPRWVKESDGTYQLCFDGNSYLHFPTETFPRGVFKLKFEIKPEADLKESYILFRHYDRIVGSISLFVRNGKLCLSMTDRNVKTALFSSFLTLPSDKYSQVEVSYDLHKIRLRVNDETQSFPLESKLALYFKPAIFGGHTKREFGVPGNAKLFKGKLKSISIEHNIQIL